jgi:mannosyltransferase
MFPLVCQIAIFFVLGYPFLCYGDTSSIRSWRSNECSGSFPSPSPAMRAISAEHDEPFVYGCQDPYEAAELNPRANASFVMLARNSELEGVLSTIESIESHFNQWFNYPYVFLNNDPFSTTFKELVSNATASPVHFGKVDGTMFGFPEWVDENWAKEEIASQGDRGILYGGLKSYHQMCRFYSGYCKASLLANSDSFINMIWLNHTIGIGGLNLM